MIQVIRSTGDSSKSSKDILNKLKDNENSLNEVLKERDEFIITLHNKDEEIEILKESQGDQTQAIKNALESIN